MRSGRVADMAATGDRLKATKAIYAGIVGFIAPGVAMLTNELLPGGDGIQGRDLLLALFLCVGFAGAAGGGTFAIENKPKAVDAPPAAGDPYPHL